MKPQTITVALTITQLEAMLQSVAITDNSNLHAMLTDAHTILVARIEHVEDAKESIREAIKLPFDQAFPIIQKRMRSTYGEEFISMPEIIEWARANVAKLLTLKE